MDNSPDEDSRPALNSVNNENLWEASLQNLSIHQQETIRSWTDHVNNFDGQQLLDAVAKSRQQAESRQWKLKTKHGSISVREKFDKVVVWIQKFIAVGDAAVQYDPGHAAIPWAAFRFVIMVMVNDTNRAGEFVAGIEQVGFLIYDCAIRESLYLNCTPFFLDMENRDDLKRHIILLYSGLLGFMIAAQAFFSTGTLRRVVKSAFLNGDEVLGLLEPISKVTDKIITICNRVDAKRQLDILASLSEIPDGSKPFRWLIDRLDENSKDMQTLLAIALESKDQLDNIEHKVDFLSRKMDGFLPYSARSEQQWQASVKWRRTFNVLKATNAIKEEPSQSDNSKILLWLSKIPYEEHHRKTQSDMVSDTGEWFFKEEAYNRWKEDPKSAILWFHGAPGRGKTKIMSLVIKNALNSHYQMLYFYCSRSSAEPERGKSEDILRCLVKQIANRHGDHRDIRIPRYIAREYKRAEKRGFAISQLDAQTCCQIVKRFAQDSGEIFVFLDALDECEEHERLNLVNAFQDIIDAIADATIKLLVSSRDDTDFRGSLSGGCLDVELLPERNQDDIRKYVNEQLSLFVKQRRVRIGGKPPTPELQQLIKRKLCEGAGGMFRWVSLQLEYLCTLKTAADVKRRLGQLPRELTKSYSELYDWKVASYEEEDINRLELVLGSMLLPDQPPARVFAHLVYLDVESYNDSQSYSELSAVEDARIASDNEQIVESRTQSDLEDGKIEKVDPLVQLVLTLSFNLLVFDSTSDRFQFAHTSVQEYLETHQIQYTDTKRNYARLAERCMHVLVESASLLRTYIYTGERDCKVLAKRDDVRRPAVEASLLDSTSLNATTNETNTNAKGRMKKYEHIQVLEFDDKVVKDINNTVGFDLRAVSFAERAWSECLISSGDLRDQPPLQDLLSTLIEQGKECSLQDANPNIFISACSVGIDELVKSWLECHPKLARLREKHPGTREVLVESCCGDQLKIVEFLVASGAHVNSWAPNSRSALFVASVRDNAQIVRKMLELGADVDSQVSEPATFLTIKDVQNLPEYNELRFRDVPPICMAIFQGAFKVVELLIQWGANIEAECYFGPPLISAAYALDPEQGEECMKILLDAGANVNVTDWNDSTALMVTLGAGNMRGSTFLIAKGANVNAVSNSTGGSVLQLASKYCLDCVPALLAAGADPNLTGTGGWTPLHSSQMEPVTAQIILPKLRNINAQDYEGDTPLSNAAWNGLQDMVRYLIEAGAEIVPSSPGPHLPWLPEHERMEGYGQDALVRAFEQTHWEVAEILVRAGEHRDQCGYYSEAVGLLEKSNTEGFRKWVEEHARRSPRNDARIQEFESKITQRYKDLKEEAYRKRAEASGLQYDPNILTTLSKT